MEFEFVTENWWMFWNPGESGLIGGMIFGALFMCTLQIIKYLAKR